jgi:hypothetical protein
MAFDPTRPLALVHGPNGASHITPDSPTRPHEGIERIRVLATDLVHPAGYSTAIAVLKNGFFGREEFLWQVNADGLVGDSSTTRPIFLVNAPEDEVAAPAVDQDPPTRVVILDIDGPMIPTTHVLVEDMAFWDRRFPAGTIAVMNTLCAESGARIVLNTTHNTPRSDAPDIEKALVAQGLDPAHLHPSDPKTRYPDLRRAEAATDWLARHPEVTEWVAFDDAAFTQEPNLIWVDPDSGITLNHLNQALDRFGCKPIIVLA